MDVWFVDLPARTGRFVVRSVVVIGRFVVPTETSVVMSSRS